MSEVYGVLTALIIMGVMIVSFNMGYSTGKRKMIKEMCKMKGEKNEKEYSPN